MGDIKKSAEYICVAAGQIDLELSTNEYGPGVKAYAKMEPFPETAIDWRDAKFKDWLENKELKSVIVLTPPLASSVIYDEVENLLLVEMIKLHTPTVEDYKAYAKKCKCDSPEEAIREYGDLHWSFSTINVLVKGIDVRLFLYFVVPYCWDW